MLNFNAREGVKSPLKPAVYDPPGSVPRPQTTSTARPVTPPPAPAREAPAPAPSTAVEVTKEAEDGWMELLFSAPRLGVIGSPDCTPGYYNNEGHPIGRAERLNMAGYPGGPVAFFQLLGDWRRSGSRTGDYRNCR